MSSSNSRSPSSRRNQPFLSPANPSLNIRKDRGYSVSSNNEIKSLLAGVDESEADSLIHISNRLSEGLTTREQLKTQLPGKRATEEKPQRESTSDNTKALSKMLKEEFSQKYGKIFKNTHSEHYNPLVDLRKRTSIRTHEGDKVDDEQVTAEIQNSLLSYFNEPQDNVTDTSRSRNVHKRGLSLLEWTQMKENSQSSQMTGPTSLDPNESKDSKLRRFLKTAVKKEEVDSDDLKEKAPFNKRQHRKNLSLQEAPTIESSSYYSFKYKRNLELFEKILGNPLFMSPQIATEKILGGYRVDRRIIYDSLLRNVEKQEIMANDVIKSKESALLRVEDQLLSDFEHQSSLLFEQQDAFILRLEMLTNSIGRTLKEDISSLEETQTELATNIHGGFQMLSHICSLVANDLSPRLGDLKSGANSILTDVQQSQSRLTEIGYMLLAFMLKLVASLFWIFARLNRFLWRSLPYFSGFSG